MPEGRETVKGDNVNRFIEMYGDPVPISAVPLRNRNDLAFKGLAQINPSDPVANLQRVFGWAIAGSNVLRVPISIAKLPGNHLQGLAMGEGMTGSCQAGA